jgi:3-oxoacyl-[acyl-carrier-protein] synthase II
MGVLTPVGNNLEEFWKNIVAGKSGIAPITCFDTSLYETKFAGELKGFDPATYVDRKLVQRTDLFTQYALAATEMALRDSGLNLDAVNKERVGVIVGSGIGGMATLEKQSAIIIKDGSPRHLSPFFITMMISDIAPGRISIRYGLKGPNYSITSACATSSHSIGDAAILIQRGDADVMVTGGAEAAICPLGIGGFNAMKALSTRNDAPEKASRPFDKTRDGFVMGEGSGIIILEELEHALNRGARIYTEVAGLGFSGDAYHITDPAPGGEGAVRSMRCAIEDAEMMPGDIAYVNTHGTSTPIGDRSETAAIKTAFGQHAYKMAVNSTKSIIGHLLGAAGAVEAITTILSIVDQKVHPTINYEVPDPDCDLNYITDGARPWPMEAAISNTFGFGGHNASLLFKKFSQ